MKIVGYAIVFGMIGAIFSFKNNLLYLGFFCMAIATISFFIVMYFYVGKDRSTEVQRQSCYRFFRHVKRVALVKEHTNGDLEYLIQSNGGVTARYIFDSKGGINRLSRSESISESSWQKILSN